MVYDKTRARVWIASPGRAGKPNQVVLLDPATGKIDQSIPFDVEPQHLALSDDGKFLYVAASGRIFRCDIGNLSIDRDFRIPALDLRSTPMEAYSMAVVPGHPDRVLVSLDSPSSSPDYWGTVLFEDGVPAAQRLVAPGPAHIFGWLDESTVVGGYGRDLYYASVDRGVQMLRVMNGVLPIDGDCTLLDGLLYCSSGAVLDAAAGAYLRQYPARGTVGLAPAVDRAVYFDRGTQVMAGGATYGPMVTVRPSSGEFLSAAVVPVSTAMTMSGAGGEWLVLRPTILAAGYTRTADRLYLFRLP